MIAARSSCLGTRNAISLSGTTDSVSVSHLSSLASSQLCFALLSASEYLKVLTEPAALPTTPLSRGPSWSASRAWHPPQRFWNRACPSCSPCPSAWDGSNAADAISARTARTRLAPGWAGRYVLITRSLIILHSLFAELQFLDACVPLSPSRIENSVPLLGVWNRRG